jgi:hypothetical protein
MARVNPTHAWLLERGWVKVGEVRFGFCVQFRWTHPRYAASQPGRTWGTSEAEYAEIREGQ